LRVAPHAHEKNKLRIQSKPIKGTLKRRKPFEKYDHHDSEALRLDPKSRSENLMISDLVRNDFGRVCEPDSVDCVSISNPKSSLCVVEKYATLLQLVTTVSGTVDKDKFSTMGVVRATFPPGSMTGAPKIRTMDIIENEVEGVGRGRGPYSGSLGWFGLGNGAAVLNVVIRTAVVSPNEEEGGNLISVGCGGAIVKDSDCEEEYNEMMAKGSVVVSAVERAAAEVEVNE